MLENFIYEKPNELSQETCKKIIELFEENRENQYPGQTGSGHNEDIKNTMDFSIPVEASFQEDNYWNPISTLLTESLQKNINIYLKSLNNSHPNYISENYKFISADFLSEETYQIQKYIKGEGKYVYHNDFTLKWDLCQYRVITFLWYLNTIEEGGETEILGSINIKPEAGKLLLFPASWIFPHRGKMPISEDKYIVTGWFHVTD
jgi:hypothetical protein